ncbi:MAG: glycosyltransferase family 2 protein [Acidobacteriota bacterium]
MRNDVVDLSIIIVNFNSCDYLRSCLASIREHTQETRYETFVVDNASADESCEMVRREFPWAKLIENENNVGFSRANNQAIRQSRGEFVLLLNNDTLVLPRAIDVMVSELRGKPAVGVVGCTLRNQDMSVQISFGKMINMHNELILKLISDRYRSGNRLVKRYLEHRSRREHYPDWVSGACLLARADALRAVDLMDENFFMYTEEVDLCHRIRQLGYLVLYTPAAEIIHFGGRSTETNLKKTIIEYRKSQLYFYKKHYGTGRMKVVKLYLLAKIMWARIRTKLRKGALSPDLPILRELSQVVRSYQ